MLSPYNTGSEGLMLHRSANPDLPLELRPAILLQSKAFDPKTYLATVHPLATFKDLSVGRERLKGVLMLNDMVRSRLIETSNRFARTTL